MILLGIGANLPTPGFPTIVATCEAALAELEARGVAVVETSPWYESAPVPASDQPWYVNGVARVETTLDPSALLEVLHDIEAAFGRERTGVNAARTLDLDLLDFSGQVTEPDSRPVLPHPRMAARAFVLLPLRDLYPDWRDPRDGRALEDLIAGLPDDQEIRRLVRDC